MITVVEKLDECENIKDYNKNLEQKVAVCDELVRTTKATNLDMSNFIAKSNETIFAQDSVILTQNKIIKNTRDALKAQKGKTIKNSLAFGVGGLTIGFGIGVLLGIFAR